MPGYNEYQEEPVRLDGSNPQSFVADVRSLARHEQLTIIRVLEVLAKAGSATKISEGWIRSQVGKGQRALASGTLTALCDLYIVEELVGSNFSPTLLTIGQPTLLKTLLADVEAIKPRELCAVSRISHNSLL